MALWKEHNLPTLQEVTDLLNDMFVNTGSKLSFDFHLSNKCILLYFLGISTANFVSSGNPSDKTSLTALTQMAWF